jgi:pimeloyl-ACP methyl ester carboxylesterase
MGFDLVSAATVAGCLMVLVPGAFGGNGSGAGHFITQEDYFREYRYFFQSKGCKIHTAEFQADSTIEERGILLRDQVDRFRKKEGGGKVFILAHSQGALDARYALKTLKLTGVAAVASIGAPHTGTPVAEWGVSHQTARSPIYWGLRLLADYDLDTLRFMGELTPAFLVKTAKYFEPVSEVRYGSARAVCTTHCHWGLRILKWWFELGPSDGLVPGENQRFGEDLGEYDLDHLSEIGVDLAKRSERTRWLTRVAAWYGIR